VESEVKNQLTYSSTKVFENVLISTAFRLYIINAVERNNKINSPIFVLIKSNSEIFGLISKNNLFEFKIRSMIKLVVISFNK
jgi:hypothetical protein